MKKSAPRQTTATTASADPQEYQFIESITPNITTGGTKWFQGGALLPAGDYRVIYDSGAVNLDDTLLWSTTHHYVHFTDNAPTPDVTIGLHGGVNAHSSLASAQAATLDGAPPEHTFTSLADNPAAAGVLLSHGPFEDHTGPGVTWTLQRRLPKVWATFNQSHVTEGDGQPLTLTLHRDSANSGDLPVTFTLAGTAQSGDDYTAPSTTVTIPAGSFSSTPITIDVTDDEMAEWTETVEVEIADSDTYWADDEDEPATCQIRDNDISMDLEEGTLVANYDDDTGNGTTDYEENGYTPDQGDDDLYELKLNIPAGVIANDQITLTIPTDFCNVYDSNTKDTRLLGDDPNATTLTWDRAADVPDSVWLEVKKGSANVDDIAIQLSVADAFAGQTIQELRTAINVKINLGENPNGASFGNVTNKELPWLVGQMVDLTAEIEAPAAWVTDATFEWTVSGDAVREYLLSEQAGRVVHLAANDGEQNTGTAMPRVKFLWILTDSLADSRAVHLSVGNLGGNDCSVQTTFVVHRPTTSFTKTLGTAAIAPQPADPFTQEPQPPYIGLILDADSGQGVTYTGRVEMPSGFTAQGSWQFVQLWMPSRQKTDTEGVWVMRNNGLWGLDNTYPGDGPWDTGADSHLSADSPHVRPDIDFDRAFELSDHFTIFVMFKVPGSDSRFVPLLQADWDFSISATLAFNQWAKVGNSAETSEDLRDARTYATWDLVHKNNSGWVRP